MFNLLDDRCIRERNCGTGYQVDPITQTCIGTRENLFFLNLFFVLYRY
jgi:hypothetical protein